MSECIDTAEMLEVDDLHGWYGESHVLHGMNLQIAKGQVVTLLGRNGAGKSTTLKAIMGMLAKRSGSVRLRGAQTIGMRSDTIAHLGVAYCPEDRGIFASLSAGENLMLPPALRKGGMPVEEIYALFPNLRERRNAPGTKLSGGEQQMLAIARILRTGSDFLLLDEPTEGLAPVIVQQIEKVLRQLRVAGYTIVLVEQNYHFASKIADLHYIVENGRVVDRIDNQTLDGKLDTLKKYLSV
jgi:branched-chain amino acid transport system ATP-binding protein